ncbi:uncharacterized protein LOC128868263 [Anastrepha ludens]|uniref:uncharacterized protein LOC128868263 n=1 Tax=Anastrepha ludens TaxID=28586 RepID=UPI0023B0C826|nr:uncharacterized protein LOC128868263 [Anastrepha ludens]
MLKKIKSQPDLKELSHIVKGIRKTAKDELLFELKRQADPATEKLKTAIECVLGESAQVRSLTQETALQIKDIDEVTSREEVLEAIKNSLPEGKVTLSVIRAMHTAYGGTQTCTISLPPASAQKLISLSKIRIGWVYCRIREKAAITRCYKCHDFGHLARNCKSEDDRTTQCFRCGGQDHKVKNCVNTPRCALCLQHGESDTNHVSGGRTCPAFQRAAQQKKV